MSVEMKRVYEKAVPSDGIRVLVDRLWPRGLSKEKAKVDVWLKDIAPSTELRKWFDHKPERWQTFQERYQKEIAEHPEALAWLKKRIKAEKVTLVYAAKDEEHNDAQVLKRLLQ